MKTLSEREHDRQAAREGREQFFRQEREQLLAEVQAKPIPLYVETQPNRICDSAARRVELRQQLAEGKAEIVAVACDHCGTVLVDRSPGLITCSVPPYRHVGCIGCGWVGFMEA